MWFHSLYSPQNSPAYSKRGDLYGKGSELCGVFHAAGVNKENKKTRRYTSNNLKWNPKGKEHRTWRHGMTFDSGQETRGRIHYTWTELMRGRWDTPGTNNTNNTNTAGTNETKPGQEQELTTREHKREGNTRHWDTRLTYDDFLLD